VERDWVLTNFLCAKIDSDNVSNTSNVTKRESQMSTQLTVTGKIDQALIEREIERDPRLKSKHTKRGYKRDLAAFEEWRAGRPITKLLVEEYAAHLQEAGKSPSTINRTLASIRWWARRVADLAFEQTMDRETRDEVLVKLAG
jgi:hypothetical protein